MKKTIELFTLLTLAASCSFGAPYTTVRFESGSQGDSHPLEASQLGTTALRAYSYSEGNIDTLTTNDSAIFGYGTNWDLSAAMVLVEGAAVTNGNYFSFSIAPSNIPLNGTYFWQVLQTNSLDNSLYVLGKGTIDVMRSPITGGATTLNLQQIVNWDQVLTFGAPWVPTNDAVYLGTLTNGVVVETNSWGITVSGHTFTLSVDTSGGGGGGGVWGTITGNISNQLDLVAYVLQQDLALLGAVQTLPVSTFDNDVDYITGMSWGALTGQPYDNANNVAWIDSQIASLNWATNGDGSIYTLYPVAISNSVTIGDSLVVATNIVVGTNAAGNSITALGTVTGGDLVATGTNSAGGSATLAQGIHVNTDLNYSKSAGVKFGDGDVFFYESFDDLLELAFLNFSKWQFHRQYFSSTGPDGPRLRQTPSETAPAYSFRTDTDTGMYRVSADKLGFSTAGTNRVTITNDGLDMNGNWLVFSLDSGAGLMWTNSLGTNRLFFSDIANMRVTSLTNGVVYTNNFAVGAL